MHQASRAKTAVKTQRTGAQPAVPRKATTAPQPIDLKTLERVAGGLLELPKKYW